MEEAVAAVGKDLGFEICESWVAKLRWLVGRCDIFLATARERERERERNEEEMVRV